MQTFKELIMHFLFASSLCLMPHNKLFINLGLLGLYILRNIGPLSFCTNFALQAQAVQKRPRSDISLYRARVHLVRSYYLPLHIGPPSYR